jgi:hypothetical protein
LVNAYLAGFPASELATPMLAWARLLVAEGRTPEFTGWASREERQAFRALVHAATMEGDSLDVAVLLEALEAAAASGGDSRTSSALRASLMARSALLAADTTEAIRQLEHSLACAPTASLMPYYPLLAMSPQRLLLAELLLSQGLKNRAERWLLSFSTNWHSIGDAVYANKVRRLRTRMQQVG